MRSRTGSADTATQVRAGLLVNTLTLRNEIIDVLVTGLLLAYQAASRCPLVHVHNFHQQFRAALQQLLHERKSGLRLLSVCE